MMMTLPQLPREMNPVRNERGMALIVALMSMLLLTGLGAALVMTTMTETLITTNYRDNSEALYAADAGVERVMQELLTTSDSDWNRRIRGEIRSSFVDGPPSGTRTLPAGGTLDLTGATNMLNCGKTSTCSVAEMNAATADRPYGANNPRWQLYAHAPMSNIIETRTVNSPMYVGIWIADDPAETDGDPTTDGSTADNPGSGILLMRAEAFGPQGTRSTIEVTVARTDTTALERGYSGQRGQDEQNRRSRKAAVKSKENKLTRSDLDLSSGGFTVR